VRRTPSKYPTSDMESRTLNHSLFLQFLSVGFNRRFVKLETRFMNVHARMPTFAWFVSGPKCSSAVVTFLTSLPTYCGYLVRHPLKPFKNGRAERRLSFAMSGEWGDVR